MAIPDSAKPTPIPAINPRVKLVTPDGFLTQEAVTLFDKWRSQNLGGGRIIPCSASGTNVLTLLPNEASPLLEGYRFGDAFLFWAANDSTDVVTAKVQPKSDNAYTLATLKVYKTNGSTQAGAGDVLGNLLYVAYYSPIQDANAGGFVLK